MKKLIIIFIIFFSVSSLAYSQSMERSSSIVTIEGQSYYVHTVLKGETIYGLTKLYGVAESDLKTANPQLIEGLREGQVLKIPATNLQEEKLSTRKKNRLFDIHTVNQGETLYAISRRYEIPVNTILGDNPGLDPASLSIGQRINIRKKSKGDATPEQISEQMEEYRDAVNSVSDDTKYHLVEKNETIYGLSVMYDVTPEAIYDVNGGLQDGLKAGAMIKIPVGKIEAGNDLTSDSVRLAEPVDSTIIDSHISYVKELEDSDMMTVALMLPLKDQGKDKGNLQFLDFYRGALLALEDLKANGISVRMNVYNTAKSVRKVEDIVGQPAFESTDLIIGPVYEENLGPALEFADQHNIALVSPLASMEHVKSPVFYQASPDASTKYDKLKQMLDGDKNIVFISTSYKDKEIEEKVRPLLPQGTRFVEFGSIKSVSFRDYISKSKENIFIVSCTNILTLDKLLASIGSVQSNIVSRGMGNPKINVFGGSSWSRNFDRKVGVDINLYFRLGVCYISSYHADRENSAVGDFYAKYLSTYKSTPSLMSYRAYDVVKLFVYSAMKSEGNDYTAKLNVADIPLLQVSYDFKESNGQNVNTNWVLVCYKEDYTIEIK